MFKIFVTVFIFSQQIGMISHKDFPTMEACEVERPVSVEKLKADLTRDYPDEKVEILDSKCDKAPE